MDLKCPNCGSENTTRIPDEIIDQSVKSTWWMIILFGVLGISVNPIILIFAFAVMIFNIVVNILVKHKHRNVWVMQCLRCRQQFTVPNPYRIEQFDKENEKAVEREAELKEKVERRKAKNLERSRLETAIMEKNARLFENETLIGEVDYFATHKNAWSTAGGNLRITDSSLLIYNKKGAFRIYKDQVCRIKRKNYFLIIPTGIQIVINDGKKRKYNFVVYYDKRKQIMQSLLAWKQNQPVESVH